MDTGVWSDHFLEKYVRQIFTSICQRKRTSFAAKLVVTACTVGKTFSVGLND